MASPIVFMEITNGHPRARVLLCPAIIDTGADCTCLPKELADNLGHDFSAGEAVKVEGVSGDGEARKHCVLMRLVGPGMHPEEPEERYVIPFQWPVMAHVLASLNVVLLGCHDFLKFFDFQISVASSEFSLTPWDAECAKAVRKWREKMKRS